MSENRFRLLRLKMKMTQKQFAEILGVSVSTVAAIENGRRPISGSVRASLVDIGVDDEFLYFLDAFEKISKIYPN